MNAALNSLKTNELLRIYNAVTGEGVKRFSDRTAALRRVTALTQNEATAEKVSALLASATVTGNDPTEEKPVPTLEQAFREGLEKDAKRRGIPGLSDKPTVGKNKLPVTASSAGGAAKEMVVVRGRRVRPENVNAVKRGASLWGAVGDDPKEKDQVQGHGNLNLNYKRKEFITPMREGTKRHRLVEAMRKKGVTPEEVMQMFGLEYGAAVYKIRDLHYMCGHGLTMREGRIYLNDD